MANADRQIPLTPPWTPRDWRRRFASDLLGDDDFRAYVEDWVEWCGRTAPARRGRTAHRAPTTVAELRRFLAHVHHSLICAGSPHRAFQEVVGAMRILGDGMARAPVDLGRPLDEVMAHLSDTLDQLALAALSEHYRFTPWGPHHRRDAAPV